MVYVIRDIDRNTTVGVATNKTNVAAMVLCYLKRLCCWDMLNDEEELNAMLHDLVTYDETSDYVENFSIEGFDTDDYEREDLEYVTKLLGETENEKPIFNVGDWVVNKLGDVWHIDSFDKKNYQVSDGKGNYNYFPISKQDEMLLWNE